MAEALVEAGHADEDDGDAGAVVEIAQHLQRGGGEPFGLVDNDQLDAAGAGWGEGLPIVEMLGDEQVDVVVEALELAGEVAGAGGDGRGVEHAAGAAGCGDNLVVDVAWAEVSAEVGFDGVPIGVAAAGHGLADAGVAVADPNGVFFADDVGELGEAAVFFRDDELAGHGRSSS